MSRNSMAESSQTEKQKTARLGPVLLVNFIGTLGYTIVIPFLVFLVTRFGGDATTYGFVAATYSTFQFIGAPILGRWSDRYGRRRILLLSQAGTFISWLLFALALFLPVTGGWTVGSATLTVPLLVIVAARALDGITGGNISVANAYVGDISTEANRSRNFGRMGIASNLGMVLGPALASVLGATIWGEALPIFAAAAIALVGVVFIASALPEPPRCSPSPHSRDDAVRALGQECRDCVTAAQDHDTSLRALLSRRPVAVVLSLHFVVMAAFSFYYAAFPINAASRLQWSVVEIGVFFAALSLMLVVVQGPVLSFLSKHITEIVLVRVGLAILAANFVLMQSRSLPLLFVAAALFAAGNGVMWPSLVSLTSRAAGDRLQGAVQGLAGSAGSLASIGGLTLGGLAYASVEAHTFLISAALSVVACLIAFGMGRGSNALH